MISQRFGSPQDRGQEVRKVDNLPTPARLGEFDQVNSGKSGWLRQGGLAERTAR
jgi:hypothetical protein